MPVDDFLITSPRYHWGGDGTLDFQVKSIPDTRNDERVYNAGCKIRRCELGVFGPTASPGSDQHLWKCGSIHCPRCARRHLLDVVHRCEEMINAAGGRYVMVTLTFDPAKLTARRAWWAFPNVANQFVRRLRHRLPTSRTAGGLKYLSIPEPNRHFYPHLHVLVTGLEDVADDVAKECARGAGAGLMRVSPRTLKNPAKYMTKTWVGDRRCAWPPVLRAYLFSIRRHLRACSPFPGLAKRSARQPATDFADTPPPERKPPAVSRPVVRRPGDLVVAGYKVMAMLEDGVALEGHGQTRAWLEAIKSARTRASLGLPQDPREIRDIEAGLKTLTINVLRPRKPSRARAPRQGRVGGRR
ncbi:MAG: hypothetical protein HYY25_01150 [Candidatus Wallbacteria bacterium]|nr:hypothetical protein [Candidatus Wallbacteria bacterium]